MLCPSWGTTCMGLGEAAWRLVSLSSPIVLCIVSGKVAIQKEDLQKYHNRDTWFQLQHVDADSEVQVRLGGACRVQGALGDRQRLRKQAGAWVLSGRMVSPFGSERGLSALFLLGSLSHFVMHD